MQKHANTRSRTSLLVLPLAIAALSGCATTDNANTAEVAEARADATPVATSQVLLTIHGMSCPLCANNVDNSLLAVPGVTDVKVDMSTGVATVTLDGVTPVTRQQLASAVDRSGFTLASFRTP